MRRWTVLIVGVALLSTAADAHATLPRADYIDRADSICKRFNPRFERRLDQLRSVQGLRDYVRAVEKLKKLSKDQFELLQRLPRPQTGEPALNRYFTRYHRALGQLQDIADTARTGDRHATNAAIDRFVKSSRAQFQAARKFGFGFCV